MQEGIPTPRRRMHKDVPTKMRTHENIPTTRSTRTYQQQGGDCRRSY